MTGTAGQINLAGQVEACRQCALALAETKRLQLQKKSTRGQSSICARCYDVAEPEAIREYGGG